ncbi:hypothetical protein AAHE18_16G212900 [Arachis hypogaea]
MQYCNSTRISYFLPLLYILLYSSMIFGAKCDAFFTPVALYSWILRKIHPLLCAKRFMSILFLKENLVLSAPSRAIARVAAASAYKTSADKRQPVRICEETP